MERLGRYELGAQLGKGGMGTVYAAWLTSALGMRVPVAVKVLHPGTGVDSVERLVQEACIGGLASHPNVVAALDVGCEDGRWFIAMEQVDGISAQQLRRRGVVPTVAALDLVAQAGAGLAYLHGLRPPGIERLVHGDIKPHNLLVDGSGAVRIADFGVACAAGVASGLGTYNYLAPEQWEGTSLQASDVFALAVVLWNLLFEDRLLEATATRRASRRIDEILVNSMVRERAAAQVPGLDKVLVQALSRDPEQRPTAEEWADAMGRLALRQQGLSLASLVRLPSQPVEMGTPSKLVGRGEELARLQERVDNDPVVWVTGPAGVGKTRLARALTGVDLFLPLGGCRLLGQFHARLARRLRVPLPASTEPGWALRALNREGIRRVVLDGVDGLLDVLVDELSERGDVRVVLTACSARVADPVVVSPLDRVSACELFVHRSGRIASTRVLEQVVERLDRLPLALELAAASGLAPEDLLFELSATGGVLQQIGGPGSGTLHAAIQRSWRLLPVPLQTALRALTTFRGRPDVDDVRAVLGGPNALADVLGLAERHLVEVRGRRVTLLGTVRAFVEGMEPLADVQRRHAERYAQRGHPDALLALKRSAGLHPFEALLRDEPELDAALVWAVANRSPLAGPLTAAKLALIHHLGPLDLGAELVRRALKVVVDPTWQAVLLEGEARLLERQGHSEQALAVATRAYKRAPAAAKDIRADCRKRAGICLLRLGRLEEADKATRAALSDAERAGDRFRAGDCHLNLSIVAYAQGDRAKEAFHQEEARRLAEATSYTLLLGATLGNIGQRLAYTGDLLGAQRAIEEGLEHLERSGDRLTYQNTRATLGSLFSQRGDFEAALKIYEEVLEHCIRQGHHTAANRYLCLQAAIEVQQGFYAQAREHLDASRVSGESFANNDLIRRLVEAKLALSEGHPERVHALLPLEEASGGMALQQQALLLRVRADLALGRLEEAGATCDRALQAELQRPMVRSEAVLLRAEIDVCRGVPGTTDLEGVRSFVRRAEMLPEAWLVKELSRVERLLNRP